MSRWTTLNAVYKEWNRPESNLRCFNEKFHPNDDIDVRMYSFKFVSEEGSREMELMKSILRGYGEVDTMFRITCQDTSMSFKVEEIDTGRKWKGLDDIESVVNRVEEDTGYRPALGGNWTE